MVGCLVACILSPELWKVKKNNNKKYICYLTLREDCQWWTKHYKALIWGPYISSDVHRHTQKYTVVDTLQVKIPWVERSRCDSLLCMKIKQNKKKGLSCHSYRSYGNRTNPYHNLMWTALIYTAKICPPRNEPCRKSYWKLWGTRLFFLWIVFDVLDLGS